MARVILVNKERPPAGGKVSRGPGGGSLLPSDQGYAGSQLKSQPESSWVTLMTRPNRVQPTPAEIRTPMTRSLTLMAS